MRWIGIAACALAAGGCSSYLYGNDPTLARDAVVALRGGLFESADEQAASALKKQRRNSRARAVRAVARFKRAMHRLSAQIRGLDLRAVLRGRADLVPLRRQLELTEKELSRVAKDLEVVARDSGFSIEICLACWEIDWNHNGRIDRRDRLLFQIERDSQGRRIPAGDPRRKPTFRFDHGDVYWALAFVSFQRAAINIVLGYDWTEPRAIMAELRLTRALRLPLASRSRLRRARGLLRDGLSYSDRARLAYLAEKDDEREWVPNPRQRSHPLPLPVDAALYRTWRDVIADLRLLVDGRTGLSVAELAQLGDHRWANPPGGYLDLSKLLSRPRDLAFDMNDLRRWRRAPVRVLRRTLGDAYAARMRRSALVSRLQRMKREVKRGKESLARKLRYLIWIN